MFLPGRGKIMKIIKIQFFNDLPRKTENLRNKPRLLHNPASGS